jgi:hypothetical protein
MMYDRSGTGVGMAFQNKVEAAESYEEPGNYG